MEALRRARFIWALLCLIIGGGMAVLFAFSPKTPAFFIGLTLWCSTWLWLPLYTTTRATAAVALVWFFGVVPLGMFADTADVAAGRSALLAVVGAVVLALAWIAAGLRRSNT